MSSYVQIVTIWSVEQIRQSLRAKLTRMARLVRWHKECNRYYGAECGVLHK